ncbi:tRNA pseudouridine synthase-like 1 isoform X1 [Stegostoma tigrinum]|uniref:tRNA pseudouridine synthase-like 1 isoform X1 n=2 Tax=Stegostoma tigrinum TaxID=3053191 RepID=UPI00202AFC41|nr:tRNA pseudouridine synthase-like 1 isoform X1 [Stegostoma tigrinum]
MAGKARYLIFFQYCGTRYSGVMKSPSHQPILGVQNYLENAVQKLRPVNEVDISISSRTDSGVHALCNSAHLDIQRKEGKPPFSAELLVDALNFHLKPEPISVIKAFRVADNFNARFRALSRTYVYRLVTGCWHRSQLPVFERNLCWPVHNIPLNVDIMKEAAQILLGTHDFSTFRSLNSETPFKSPLKTLLQVDIIPGFSISLQQDFHSHLKFWELTFKSRSFLYKQVRRMTGALVAVGQGKLMPRHIADLLEMRDSRAYPPNIIAPPDGLFLKNVEYNTKDLEVEESVIQ